MVRSRTASSNELRHKFLARRSTPSLERTMRLRASSVKVLCESATLSSLEEQANAAQRGDLHQMRVFDDGGEHLAGAVQAPGLLDETLPAAAVGALTFDLKGLAQDAQRAVAGVQSPVDDRGHEVFGVVLAQGRV